MSPTTNDARGAAPKPQAGWFATTRWSVVISAGQGDGVQSRAALEELCRQYWLPIYSFVRRRGYSAEDAQDLTQEFFARLMERNRVARADQQKGRFRAFMLGTLKFFLSNEWDKSRALKRGGGTQILPLQFDTGEATYELEPVENVTPEQIYERRWVLTLLDGVLTRLRADYAREGKGLLFNALSPCLVGERTDQPYAELAEQLGLSESAIKSAVHRLRKRYRERLRLEIANTVSSPEEVDDELNYLFQVLARR